MTTITELEILLESGFSDNESLIKQSDIQSFVKDLHKLDDSTQNKGYTLPILDTIGINLYGKFSSQIENI